MVKRKWARSVPRMHVRLWFGAKVVLSRGEFAGRLQIVKRGSIQRGVAVLRSPRCGHEGPSSPARAAPFQRGRFSAARHEPRPADRTWQPGKGLQKRSSTLVKQVLTALGADDHAHHLERRAGPPHGVHRLRPDGPEADLLDGGPRPAASDPGDIRGTSTRSTTLEHVRFARVIDPEGNKVELWQPPAGQ